MNMGPNVVVATAKGNRRADAGFPHSWPTTKSGRRRPVAVASYRDENQTMAYRAMV